jgi:hypothetical protein
MSRARELADLSNVINKGANLQPNLIINGDMAVSQRGTSETGITSTQYANAPDRWNFQVSSLGTWTASQSTTAPDGFSNSYKIECTTADASPSASDFLALQQRIEGQNLQVLDSGSANAKKFTFSFWVRSSKTGTYNCEITHIDGSVFNSIQYTIDTADTWERKTLTFDGYQTTAIANDNTEGFRATWWLGAGTTYTSGTHNSNTWHSTAANRAVGNVNLGDSTSNDWYVTGVSLVVGDTAPVTHPYESYDENLKKCQRYFSRIEPKENQAGFEVISIYNTASKYFVLKYPMPMRVKPTIALSSYTHLTLYSAGTSNIPTAFNAFGGTNERFEGRFTSGTLTTGYSGFVRWNTYDGSAFLNMDAEL